MSDQSREADSPELFEDIEIVISDPSGPPKPLPAKHGMNAVAGAAIILVAGASTMHMIGAKMMTTCGATQSAQLQWQQRQAEMQRVLAEEEAALDQADSHAVPDEDSTNESDSD